MAGAATAEQYRYDFTPLFEAEPLVYAVPEMDFDALNRRRAAHFIGSVALGQSTVFERSAPSTIESLDEAISLAARGNEAASRLVETNIRTDVIERTIKAGHVMQVELDIDESGAIAQHGQTNLRIQANSLLFAADHLAMRPRVEAETRNAFRLDAANRAGWLDDCYFLVLSRAPDDMSTKEMADQGFFTDTMSVAIQLTTKDGEQIVTESAFVAGVATPGEDRHDGDTIVSLVAQWGLDVRDKTTTELIDTPLLIHKSLLPNGVIDVVQHYDKAAGNTFFGEAKPTQDYAAYREICRQREASFEPAVRAIKADLLAEAATIQGPAHATQRLAKLSEHHMVEVSVTDKTINPRVFGRQAAQHIYSARLELDQGNMAAVQHELARARATAESYSCPSGANKAGTEAGEREADDKHEAGDKYGSLSFKCPKGHVNTRPYGQLVEKCRTCKMSVRCA